MFITYGFLILLYIRISYLKFQASISTLASSDWSFFIWKSELNFYFFTLQNEGVGSLFIHVFSSLFWADLLYILKICLGQHITCSILILIIRPNFHINSCFDLLFYWVDILYVLGECFFLFKIVSNPIKIPRASPSSIILCYEKVKVIHQHIKDFIVKEMSNDFISKVQAFFNGLKTPQYNQFYKDFKAILKG